MKDLAYAMSVVALAVAGTATAAETDQNTLEEIVVTATRRSERLQDVPLSVTAFSQAELTQKGIVGYEGIARETPGAVLNVASDNNARLTARGISTNGWGAGLQTTTTIYLDELPLSTIGNTVTLNPNLYDIERVEFLRGPQGTLFGSGSLSGALRILTQQSRSQGLRCVRPGRHRPYARWRRHAPALQRHGQHSAGHGYAGAARRRLSSRTKRATSTMSAPASKNSNTLKDSGGRAILLWQPTERLQRSSCWAPMRTAIPRTLR